MRRPACPNAKNLLLALALVALAPLAAGAGTSDGTTPAEESVCDTLLEATPGLYGLCVAYCEAQDCDSIGMALSGQCEAPNPRLLDHYDRKRQAGDPGMPCLAPETPEPPPCLCYGVEDLRAMELDSCVELQFSAAGALGLTDAEERNGAMVEWGSGWGMCGLVRDGSAGLHEITEEEAYACETVLRFQADEDGLVCE